MDNFTTSANPQPTLTLDDIQKAIDLVCPVLYYATDANLAKGHCIYARETELSPEFIVCHPDDLETIKERIPSRRLVHIKDEPPEEMVRRLKEKLNRHEWVFISPMLYREHPIITSS